MSFLANKVAVVTGGTSGIGYETAKCLTSEGAVVYACARHEKELPDGIFYQY